MELRIYNREMAFMGVIESITALQWNRKYYEAGDFELHLPVTEYNMRLIALGNLLWIRGKVEAGVMEDIQLISNAKKQECVVKGRFTSSYMDRRLIRPRKTFSGAVEVAMRTLLDEAVEIPNVVLGDLKNLPATVSFQATYKNLLTYETKLAQSAGYGFRFVPDFAEKTLTFEVYNGVDRSTSQMERTKVEFSEKFNNLASLTYQLNNQIYKNLAYVGGEGEGLDRTFVVVGDDTVTGLDRREVYVDARGIQKEDGMTDAQYTALLEEEGNKALKEDILSESLEFDTDPNGNFVYLRDFDLGDIVTVKKESWGVSTDMRITEISEVYERGYIKITPTFGNPLPTSIDWEDD